MRGETGGGGIDLFRYKRQILQFWLLHFARVDKNQWPETVVVEDGATPHTHAY